MVQTSPATLDSALSASSLQGSPLPAGGSDPNRFDWQEAWYPIAYISDLKKNQLTRFVLLDNPLVIWWEPTTETWRVFADKCPHRLAPLSEGRVNEAGQLECPYHGWAFSGEGVCEHIPQQPETLQAHLSARACATSLPTTICQDLLFVYPGNAAHAAQVPVPVIEPLIDDPEGWVVLNTFRDLPYDALTLLENVLDASHIPFTHHKTVGKRENAAPMAMEVLAADKQGFRGIWPEGPRKGKLGTQHTRFVAPALMYHDLTSQQFGRTLTVVYAVPTRKGECRLFARFPFKFSAKLPGWFIQLTPRWYSHIGNNGVLEDDQIFLHLQERQLEKAGNKRYAQACYLPTQADRYVLAFRQWVRDFEADPFVGQRLPSEWSRSALLDRYHSHTQHCGSCAPALANIQRWRRVAAGVAFLSLSLTPLAAIALGSGLGTGLTTLALLAGASWYGLGRLERRFYEGRSVPPRNLSKA
ncbi:aromatic ring-hydroxylating dioxygenase subunit alpha [Almyronema epifaneia]|uniref:Rieske 2Fe-2S domain-containing protein n=1 Tax=Almyronema epifaneia S1 TaxID=2991925 RepID=A0ABW6IK28_9CYAN